MKAILDKGEYMELLTGLVICVVFFLCLATVYVVVTEFSKGKYNYLQKENESLKSENSLFQSQIEMIRCESLASYKLGLHDGLNINKDKPVSNIDTKPIKTFAEHKEIIIEVKEAKAEQKKINDDMENLFSYDPYKVKEENK